MTAPSKKDVDSMANILRAMSGDKSGLISEASNNQVQGNDNVDITPGVKKADIKAMENIMKNFQNATSNVAQKVATTINEAKKTEKGIQVGYYSVEKTSDEAYDIKDSRTQDTLFESIRLYETAYVIVKHLNKGKKINPEDITKVISANAIFEKYYYDALQHKHSYKVAKKRGDLHKMDIAEARFSRSKSEAKQAKSQISKIFESEKN